MANGLMLRAASSSLIDVTNGCESSIPSSDLERISVSLSGAQIYIRGSSFHGASHTPLRWILTGGIKMLENDICPK